MRFKSIDSLRGLAAAAVVFYHLWNRFYPGATSQNPLFAIPIGFAPHLTFFLFGLGYLGVNLFFVLSGFCIHLPQALKFHATGSDEFVGGKFARRRFWRLYPAYFASLVWTSLVLLALPLLAALLHHSHKRLLAAAELPNLLVNAGFIQQFHPASLDFNGVYWTLVYEVQFYFFYPLLLWFCRRWRFHWMLTVLLACEIVFIVKPIPIPDFFLGRFYEWFLGMYLAEYIASRRRLNLPILLFPALLAISVGLIFHPSTWPYRDVFASTAFAALLGTTLEREGRWHWVTDTRLAAIGVFSYSLYLFHVPALDLFWNTTRLLHALNPRIPQWLASLGVPASFFLGYFSYRYFEAPFIGQKKPEPVLATGTAERGW